MPISNSTPTPQVLRNAERPSGSPDGRQRCAWQQRTSRPRPDGSASRDGVQRSPGLIHMEPVVPRQHPEEQVEALRATLGVDPDPSSILLGGACPERHVGGAERAEQLEELVRVVMTAGVESIDPKVLVVADQRRLVVREDPPV